jgi:cytochrome oxidase assembly protein ShyY1
MAPPVSAGKRVFAPTLPFTLLALVLAALFVRLGVWQWQRGEQRQAAATRFARGADQVLELGTHDVSEAPLYQRASVEGELDGAHQFLLDNRTFEGRAGYEVLTPLVRAAAPALLVDRGWVPFTGSRARLPDVTLRAGGPVRLTGRVAALPSPGLASGRAAPSGAGPWPKVTSYPDMAQLAAALGRPLSSRILLLDAAAPLGYVRAWQPPGLPPLRHFSYAVQWWSFALATLALWALLSRRPQPPKAHL